MAGEQRKVAVASKREGSSMKMLSLLGTLFLPGAYIAVSLLAPYSPITDDLAIVHTVDEFLRLSNLSGLDNRSIASVLDLLGSNDSFDIDNSHYMVYLGEATRGSL